MTFFLFELINILCTLTYQTYIFIVIKLIYRLVFDYDCENKVVR